MTRKTIFIAALAAAIAFPAAASASCVSKPRSKQKTYAPKPPSAKSLRRSGPIFVPSSSSAASLRWKITAPVSLTGRCGTALSACVIAALIPALDLAADLVPALALFSQSVFSSRVAARTDN